MLYENLILILDTSREKDVDVIIAEQMAVSEARENTAGIRVAGDFLEKHYDAITKCRRMDDNETIKKLCELSVSDEAAFKALLNEIIEREEK